jgi:hypothetical protein
VVYRIKYLFHKKSKKRRLAAMEKKQDASRSIPESVTLGTVSRAKGRRAIPVIYFRVEGVVRSGIETLGKANTLEEALIIARRDESFREADNLPKE